MKLFTTYFIVLRDQEIHIIATKRKAMKNFILVVLLVLGIFVYAEGNATVVGSVAGIELTALPSSYTKVAFADDSGFNFSITKEDKARIINYLKAYQGLVGVYDGKLGEIKRMISIINISDRTNIILTFMGRNEKTSCMLEVTKNPSYQKKYITLSNDEVTSLISLLKKNTQVTNDKLESFRKVMQYKID